jgi:hypothetical protein
MAMEGYDNVRMKFFRSMIDNHFDTGVIFMEGNYQPANRTFTYNTELEVVPGRKVKMRTTVRLVDGDHYTEERFEDHDGHEVRVTELVFTRQNK